MLRDLERTPVLSPDGVVLSRKVLRDIRKVALRLSDHERSIEGRWKRRLGTIFGEPPDKARMKALAAINPGRSFSTLAEGALADFLENVEYHARRLAKLDVSSAQVFASVAEYEKALLAELKKRFPEDYGAYRSALDHLYFCIKLTLNNAYYQVRDIEATAFYDVLQDQLESLSVDDLLKRVLETLTRTFRADAGVIVLRESGSERLTAKAWKGMRAAMASSFSSTVGEGLAGEIAADGLPRWLLDVAGEKSVAAKIRRRFHSVWGVPLTVRGKVTGVVELAFSQEYHCLPREMKLFEAIAERCALAIDKAQLLEELHRSKEQIRALGEHMLKVEEEERRRISRELHDEVGQSLLVVRLYIEMVQSGLGDEQAELRTKLEEARTVAEDTIVEMRRLISSLSPSVLAELGLPASIRQFVKNLGRTFPGRVRLHMSNVDDLPHSAKIMMYRLAQECFTNAVKHSNARNVRIDLTRKNGTVRLVMTDDGTGFDLAEATRKRESFGLVGMRERVALLGGEIDIQTAPGKGAKVSIAIPI